MGARSGPCDGCGVPLEGGTDACHAIFEALLARDFSDAMYFVSHRLLVDTYCLQHPDRYCVSFKSLAAHLMGLCWSLEHSGSRAVPSEAVRRWVERNPDLEKPALPAFRGGITVDDVAAADSVQAHSRLVEEWALSTWHAYASLHADARRWTELALRARSESRRSQPTISNGR